MARLSLRKDQGEIGRSELDHSEREDCRRMKHKNSHLLVGYWSQLRRGRLLPDQTDFDPRAIKRMLADFFILDASNVSRPTYRLAGTALCDRFGFELKGANYFSHWEAQSGVTLISLMKQSLKLRLPLCLNSIAATADNGMVELETVLAPVTWAGRPSRFMGMTQILSDAAPLVGRTIVFERLVGSNIVREGGPSWADDRSRGDPAARTHPRAPYLRLVVDRDPASVREENEALLERMAKALGVELDRDSQRVS